MINNSSVFIITHADVHIDPDFPVTQWGLSDIGREKHNCFNKHFITKNISSIYCSTEKKAIDSATILSEYLNITIQVLECLCEHDRSSTGYLNHNEYGLAVDEFYKKPNSSINGWETAENTQKRIIFCIKRIIKDSTSNGDTAIFTHAGVSTVLLCFLLGEGISKKYIQPLDSGGFYYVFDKSSLCLRHSWERIYK